MIAYHTRDTMNSVYNIFLLKELCNQRCHIAGTVEGIGGAQCDNLTGECICKDNFAGSTCDTPRG